MSFDLTRKFLGNSILGLFGTGHLGRAIAKGLLDAGFPRQNLAICHRGSRDTEGELAAAGLSDLAIGREEVAERSRILFYLVRPQDRSAIGDFKLREDCLFVSFLAGVPLRNLPLDIAYEQRVRVMTSAPDTLRQRKGIAALYPTDTPLIREVLEALGLRIVALRQESDIHAFTALGPCLPIVLTYWDSLGYRIEDSELLETAERFGLPDYYPILQWAHVVRPKGLADEARDRYLAQAATPGGVTDAILTAIGKGMSLANALGRGIERSRELAAG